MQPKLIADYPCEVGENPLWHPVENKLYWADIPAGLIYSYDPSSEIHKKVYEGDVVGGFTFQADGSILLFMEHGKIATLKEGVLTNVVDYIEGEEDFRFNDVIADPEGRVFCGTIALKESDQGVSPGRLYRLDRNCSLTQVVDNVGISNGMGFNLKRNKMYYTDSIEGIDVFDYDQSTGEISNRQVLIRSKVEGSMDGMTVDSEGNIWSANWGGYGVFGYRPNGDFIRKVEFPTEAVASVTFGGVGYTDMYVATAGGHERDKNGPEAGSTYKVGMGAKGLPEFLSKIAI
jgi:sugar lactone lactonase YvrE